MAQAMTAGAGKEGASGKRHMLRVIPGPCDFINRHTATPYMVFERSREESYFILASQSGYRINAF